MTFVRGKLIATLLVPAALLAGCGSSSSPSAPSGGAVTRAADLMAKLPGYRISAVMTITTPAAGAQQVEMSGSIDRSIRAGTLVAEQSVLGRNVSFTEVFSGLTFYLHASGFPQLTRLTGGKHWLKLDMSRMLGAVGLSDLPTSGTDPSQFVDYLRAVSSSEMRVGTASIRGVETTHYRATIDLDRYPGLVPASQRPSAQQGVTTLEQTLGTHTLPIDAWIDAGGRVRRLALQMNECAAGQHVAVGLTMDLFDYGPQPVPAIPSASDVYDITSLLSATLSKVKLGCTQ